MTRKELALLVVSTLFTLLLAVGLIRWLAPNLLGGPTDLQLVQSSREVPPFFEGVFRPEHFQTTDALLKDPRTLNRARPFQGEIPHLSIGPHDVLGFRNRAVPATADVVTIGDSQTYGVNALLDDNWPMLMAAGLHGASVYSMAVGGWGAVQYADMFVNAAAFRPRVVVVAFYTGNDPLDSFALAYGSDLWRLLRPHDDITAEAAPSAPFPPPESEWWTVETGGQRVAFTPALRLLNNGPHRAVDAGYGVMRRAAEIMSSVAQREGRQVVFTIVPTKELAYAQRLAAEKIEAPQAYSELVRHETERIDKLAEFLTRLPNATYVDLVRPLQAAVLDDPALYPENINGHPLAAGYAVIAAALAPAVARHVPRAPEGWVALAADEEGRTGTFLLVRDGAAWKFSSASQITQNGWPGVPKAPYVTARDLAGIPKREVPGVDPKRFGPR